METLKKCLICLDGGNIGNEEESENHKNNPGELKFRALSRYLALQDKSSLWRRATVCVECQNLLDKFEGLYQSLEKERMKVNACLKQIHNIMMEGSCHEEENAQDSENVEEDDLRKDILKKCEAELKRWEPKLKLQKMQFFSAEGTLAYVWKPLKPSSIRASLGTGVTNVIPVPFLTPDPDPAPPMEEFVVSDRDDSVGDMDTSDLFHPENFQTSEGEDVVIDHDSDSAEDEDIVGRKLNPKVHSERNKECAGNFRPVGFKDLGNGTQEKLYFCKICYDPNITDTAEHMRLNHTNNELEMALPEQQPVTKNKKARSTPIETSSKALSLSTKSRTGVARRGGGPRPAPQPDFIIRKERVWKYGQRIWTYQCKLCDVTVLGVHLSVHKNKFTHKSNEKNYYKRLSQSNVRRTHMASFHPPAENKMHMRLNHTNIEAEMDAPPAEPEPQVAVSKVFEGQAEQQPVGKNKKASATPIETNSKALSKTKNGGARRGGSKLGPQPDFIIRKERVLKYGRMIWSYDCKLCDVKVLAVHLSNHKRKESHRSNEKNYYKRLSQSQSDGRRAPKPSLYPPAEDKISDGPGTSMESSSDILTPRMCRQKPKFLSPTVSTLKNKKKTGRHRRPLANFPEYVIRKEKIFIYGRGLWKFQCQLCNVSIISSNLRRHLRTHGEGKGKPMIWSKSSSGPSQSQARKCFVRRKPKPAPAPDFIKRTGTVFKYGRRMPLYHCSICNISTVDMTRHKRKHGLNRFPCSNCTQTFQQTDALVRHISTRHGEILFHDYKKPLVEENTFRDMVAHMFRNLDKKAVGVVSTSEIDPTQTQKVYTCCFCNEDDDNNNDSDGNQSQAEGPVQFKIFKMWRNHLFEKHRAEIGRQLEKMQMQLLGDHSEDELLM